MHVNGVICVALRCDNNDVKLPDPVSVMQSGDNELIVSASADAFVQLWSSSSTTLAEQQKLPHKDKVPHLPTSRTPKSSFAKEGCPSNRPDMHCLEHTSGPKNLY